MQKYKAIKGNGGCWYIQIGNKVVASTNPHMDIVPSFDVPEEWEEPMDYRYYNGNIDAYEQQCFDFKDGYNAAKEKYKWTDEDMEKCLN
jgi:hypothetical protein